MSKLPGQNPLQPVVGFFNLLFWTWRFRARLEHPAPGWTVLDGPAGSSRPTWCAGAAPGLCQRFRFTSHPQVFTSEAACRPPFADPAANPGEKKSGARHALARVNFTGQWRTFETASDDFRRTSPSHRVFPRKAPTSPTTGADGFYRLPKLRLKKMATGKESTAWPLTFCRQAPAQGAGTLAARLLRIIQALRNVEKPCPTLLWNRNWFKREQCFFFGKF